MNWDAATEETVQNLSRLIQAETVNPPGNETLAIRIVKEILDREGFPQSAYTIVESAPGRANLVARLRGDGSARPLLLTGHVDVVPVERQHWSRDPFGGEVADGCVWGRGALDMKGDVARYLETFLLAYRQKLPLKRDLIFAAIADEEAGFKSGSRFLVEHHRELINAEYALNEGGAMTIYLAGARLYPIQVAEKSVCWLRASAHGRVGHGSMPHEDNAVMHLAQALDRLRRAGHLPVHITPPMERMLAGMARQMRFPIGMLIGWMRQPGLARLLMRRLPPESRPLFVALLTNSVSPTVLQAGAKTNVIPSTAQVDLDCRLLPGQTPQDAMRELRAIVGDRLELEPIFVSTGTNFSMDTPLYRLLESATRRMDAEGVVVPMLMPGATDACEYQKAGITVYGFTPGIFPENFPITKLAHGHDERLPISAIRTGLPVLWEVVNEFCCTSS